MSTINRNKLLRSAELTTGLSDFGTADYEHPLDLIIEGMNSSADLNMRGKIGAWIYLHRLVSNRLRLNHLIEQSPAAQAEKIDAPVFILGLPRTRSTLLHELLSCHPNLRAPTFWETTYVPTKGGLDNIRKGLAAVQVAAVDALAPGLKRVHKLGTFLPHECVTIQAPAFRSMQFHAAHRLTTYNEWLATCDWAPAYEFHRQFLKWLQYGEPKSRWVLKAPGHLLGIDSLIETYPDAKIIQLHRNPLEVIPSMASLFQHLRKPFSKRMDLEEIGRDVSEQWRQGLTRTLDYRAAHANLSGQFLDIHYKTLVTEPLKVVEEITGFLGLPHDSSIAAGFERYLAANPKNKFGSHAYTLEQFGLSPDELAEDFSEYTYAFAA